ncbi:uncharacterized protein LOC108225734 [Daucus carota subsp. sativus]
MKHFSHEHVLILNETYISREGDVCRGCNDKIFSCKSFVYSCSLSESSSSVDNECLHFLLHKTCAESPPEMEVQLLISCPEFPEKLLIGCDYKFLLLHSKPFSHVKPPLNNILRMRTRCAICGIDWKCFSYCSMGGKFIVCLKCAIHLIHSVEDAKFHHQSHTQHPLVLIQNPTSFYCHACKVEDNIRDMSYKCTECQFWIHKTCADAPASFPFPFHDKHPLFLRFSLPKVYHKFDQYCRLCYETLNRLNWLYYCPKCRFFVHFQCARSNQMSRSSENDIYSNLVHLPATNESSLVEESVKLMISSLSHSNNSTILGTRILIRDWADDEHNLQLITINELHDEKDDITELLLLCDGCGKPIQTTDGKLFYCCVLCKYFLHKACAELPKEIEHHLWPGKKFNALRCSEQDHSICELCGDICNNGIIFVNRVIDIKLHLACAMLPKLIKHEVHRHQLTQQICTRYNWCKACGQLFMYILHGCENCDFYICGECSMKARTIEHRWDPHPLHLIYDPSMVINHEHDFNCEFCSEDIDTNYWFYHCGDCDLSFHTTCANTSTLTHRQRIPLHPHHVTFSPTLPKLYRDSPDVFCQFCSARGNILQWVYYCTVCTYFCHFDCVAPPFDKNFRLVAYVNKLWDSDSDEE